MSAPVNQVPEWNQIFIDTLIATNTANSSSQRLGAIVHTAIFDAYNGIEKRYTPIFVHNSAPHGASRRAAVIAAAYTALVGVFPSRQSALDDSYAASLAALSDITSSHFPQFDRNPNTGEDLGASDKVRIARQTVFHSADKPSHILLPVVELPAKEESDTDRH